MLWWTPIQLILKMEHPSSSAGPRILQETEVPSTSGASSLDSSLAVEFPKFKGQTEYQILILQRLVQEIKNAYRVDKEKGDTMMKEISSFKSVIKMMETKITSLQKVVAMQTDNSNKFKKEISDKEAAAKAETTTIKQDIATLKTEVETLNRKVGELERNRGAVGGASNANIPDNLAQMFEALERQLGMYDVRIAEMDLRFQVLETTSYNGCLVWRIRDYDRRKEDAKRGRTLSLYSQPFYTSRYGYKMCTRIYLNGDGMGKGTHISLFFVVMKGEYDALLAWPFRQKVTLMLLDQSPDRRHLSDTFRPDPASSSFKRPTSDMNIASGCPLFVSHAVVDGSNYVQDDTIFIRIVVETADLENF